jgi:glutathione S-transferase
MKLYSFPISPNGKRVNVCAAEAGVALDPAMLDIAKGELRSPEYMALNPMGKAPTLADGDFTLWESGAIVCYVAQKSGSPLWPREPRDLSDTLRWLFFCSCHIDPYLTTLMVERFIKARRGLPPDEVHTAYAEQWLSRFIPIVEQQLKGRPYLRGEFGLADILLGCSLELGPLVKLDLGPYPAVRAWIDRLQARDSWRASMALVRTLERSERAD